MLFGDLVYDSIKVSICRTRTTKSHLLRAMGRGVEGGVGCLLPGGKQEHAEAAIVEKGEQEGVAELYWSKSFD